MSRPLPPKYRPGRTIKPGQDIRPVGEGWIRVTDREDIPGRGIRLTLDGGREFWVEPGSTYETRLLSKED